MGTRSLTYVYEGKKEDWVLPFVCMYRQFDGYPAGHGAELADFLNGGKIVNGIPGGSNVRLFNGMGCLAAQLVANFKDGAGGIYLYPARLKQDCWQEYEYHVWEDTVRVTDTNDILFEGSWEDFEAFCFQPTEVE
jgi:hypothetical protein